MSVFGLCVLCDHVSRWRAAVVVSWRSLLCRGGVVVPQACVLTLHVAGFDLDTVKLLMMMFVSVLEKG